MATIKVRHLPALGVLALADGHLRSSGRELGDMPEEPCDKYDECDEGHYPVAWPALTFCGLAQTLCFSNIEQPKDFKFEGNPAEHWYRDQCMMNDYAMGGANWKDKLAHTSGDHETANPSYPKLETPDTLDLSGWPQNVMDACEEHNICARQNWQAMDDAPLAALNNGKPFEGLKYGDEKGQKLSFMATVGSYLDRPILDELWTDPNRTDSRVKGPRDAWFFNPIAFTHNEINQKGQMEMNPNQSVDRLVKAIPGALARGYKEFSVPTFTWIDEKSIKVKWQEWIDLCAQEETCKKHVKWVTTHNYANGMEDCTYASGVNRANIGVREARYLVEYARAKGFTIKGYIINEAGILDFGVPGGSANPQLKCASEDQFAGYVDGYMTTLKEVMSHDSDLAGVYWFNYGGKYNAKETEKAGGMPSALWKTYKSTHNGGNGPEKTEWTAAGKIYGKHCKEGFKKCRCIKGSRAEASKFAPPKLYEKRPEGHDLPPWEKTPEENKADEAEAKNPDRVADQTPGEQTAEEKAESKSKNAGMDSEKSVANVLAVGTIVLALLCS